MAGRKKTEAALEKETSIEENFARLEDIIKKLPENTGFSGALRSVINFDC